mmetsp:Transcript_44482/g.53403  ORF Transcript_44482/g.53403 Transcript_44482/m.53403 type:complete len:137 (+) Transcript_44482:127-537(+)
MPAAHPILTQKQCVDYSFMEIKDVRDIMMNKSESETDDANKDTKRGNQPSNSVLEVPPASQDEENSIHKLSNIKSLKLNSNEIKSLVPLYQCLNHVIKSPSVIQWVDLCKFGSHMTGNLYQVCGHQMKAFSLKVLF